MKSKAFGLDLGTTSIKAVWLGSNNNKITLESIVAAPSSSKGILSDSSLDQKVFADSIKTVLKNASISTQNVNIAIPESQVYAKVIEMPELSERELDSALKWEMEQHIPLPLDQVKTDSQILDHIEENGKKMMNVMIVAAPTAIIEKYEKILTAAELVPQMIETEVLSVHRALNPILNPNSADIIIHLGASTTTVAVIKNKVINMVFSIPLGGIAITRAIAVDFGIDANQAENFKKAYGLTQNVFEGKIGRALEPILQSIVGDIKKAILSFKQKNPSNEITQVILSGGSALLPGLHIFFTNILGIQVVVGNCWEINGLSDVPQEILEDAPSYNVVLGLALKNVT